MTDTTSRPRRPFSAGFSLLEMLGVIALIGVITALAVPSIGNISNASRIAVAQRNAQNLTSVFNSGYAAGVPSFVLCTNVREAAQALNTGGTATTGPFAGKLFKCTFNLTADDAEPANEFKVLWYLDWIDNNLSYDRSGGHTN